ncbi:MAG: hypothetical protein KDA25_01225, partial [Phycisphaerales bacterium]|nr:hypothetical protein [Phycisphaerales bacterium]
AHHARGLRIELDLGQFGGLLPFEAQQALHAILPGRIGDADDALSAVYTDAFEQALHDSGWFDHTHHLAALSEMLEDERMYGARGRSTT